MEIVRLGQTKGQRRLVRLLTKGDAAKMDWILLWTIALINIVLLFYFVQKPPIKDWLLVFLLKVFISTSLDQFVVSAGLIEYPVRFFPNYFNTSLLFDYLVFPILCLIYNQTTYHSTVRMILFQAMVYSGVMTVVEWLLERYTDLVHYVRWDAMTTFFSLLFTFLFVRAAMAVIRKWDLRMGT